MTATALRTRPRRWRRSSSRAPAAASSVAVGEIVTCAVDLAMFHDSSGPRRLQPMLEELGAQIWDKSRVVLVMDHYVPERDDDSRRIVRIARDWARDQQLPHVYDSQGICHVVVPQHGHIRPGMLCVGGDSHSPTGGAFGAYMFGIGSTEMLGVVVTGEIWLRVPRDDPHVVGRRAARRRDGQGHDAAHDRPLRHERRRATRRSSSAAPAVTALSMQERMTLSNMSAELGAQAGLIAPDATTARLARRGRRADGRHRALVHRRRRRRRRATASTPPRWSRRSPRRTARPTRTA